MYRIRKASIPAPLSNGISTSSVATNMTMQDEFLKDVVENLNIGIVVIDSSDTIIIFNKLAGVMLHQEPTERIGSSILRCHGSISEGPVIKMLTDLRNGVMGHYEGWVNFRDRMLYEYIYPLWNAKGVCIGVVEELHDAAEKAGYLKMKGEWREIHVSGLGEKSPRSPHENVQ
jgi:DUF438 domain-containing protein